MRRKFSATTVLALLALTSFGQTIEIQAQTSRINVSSTTQTSKMNVAILIWDGVQIIDYTGPYEVLGSWGRRNVYTVAETSEPITTNMGMRVIPNYSFANQPKADIVVIPGGGLWQAKSPLNNLKLIKWIQDNAKDASHVLSVCGGSLLLAKAGLLDGLEVTTTAGGNMDKLKEFAPKARIVMDKRFIDNGKIITSAGLSAGIDGALHLVSVLDGIAWAQRIALSIEYNWSAESNYARANLADMKLPASIYGSFLNSAEPAGSKGDVERWEEQWLVKTTRSAAELLESINQQWATETKWSRESLGSNNAPVSFWKFTDPEGQTWQASASIAPATGAKLLLTLRIARNDSSAQKLSRLATVGYESDFDAATGNPESNFVVDNSNLFPIREDQF